VIILGVILLIVGFLANISILWTIGIILVVIGLILFRPGNGRPGGRWAQALLLSCRPPCHPEAAERMIRTARVRPAPGGGGTPAHLVLGNEGGQRGNR